MHVPRRALGASILTVALVTTACSGVAATPTTVLVATPGSSVSLATAVVASPTPSPAPLPGGRLGYGVFSATGLALFTANVDGTDTTRLRVPKGAEGPRFSPDGRRLAVTGTSPQVVFGLVNPDGSGYVRIASPDPTLTLACTVWSPDASRLACAGWDDGKPARNGIYTVRASDGGGLTRVTTNPGGALDEPGDYSPDGRRIVFVRDNPVDEEANTLMVVNVDGSNAHALTDQKVGGPSNRWSPDGLTILTDRYGSLLLVPVGGGQPTPINIDEPVTWPASRAAWSPDGAWIVFTQGSATGEDLYIVRKDGTNLHQVTNTPGQDEEFGDWGITAP
jgi:Tol biopolymer transport system component